MKCKNLHCAEREKKKKTNKKKDKVRIKSKFLML